MKTSSKQRFRGRPTTFNREAVLTLAMNCYWCEGVKTLSINEICRRISIAKPTLYREFGGEDGLLQAVLEHYEKEVLGSLLPLVLEAPTLQLGLQELMIAITTPSENPLGCLFVRLKQNASQLGPLTRTLVEQLQKKMQLLYQNLIDIDQKKGLVRDDIDTAFVAKYIDTQLMTMLEQISRGEDMKMVRKQGELALSVLFPKEE